MNRTKSEPQMAGYLHARGRQLGLPIAGNFELTARCNFRCPMCYVHQEGNEPREAADRGMVFALLTCGEPFLRRDFFEIYHAMKELGLLVSINSNGSLLSGEIRRRLLEEPPQRINISLYGGCGETYRQMCGRDALRRETAAIRMPKECAHCPRRELCPVCAAVCVTETGAFDRVPEYACRQTTQMIVTTWREYEQRCKE